MIPLRDENPTHSTPVLTVALIVANVLVFLYESSLPPGQLQAFFARFAAIPAAITAAPAAATQEGFGAYAGVLTSMFLHGGWAHLIGNMWFLWIFGDNIEDFLGRAGYLAFYLVTGIAATMTHVLTNISSPVPLVGASGAISGILGAYVVLHPRIRINTLVIFGFFWRILPVPAVAFLAIWFLMQIFGGFQPGGQVAYGAHIGGFVAGALCILVFTRRRPGTDSFARYDSLRDPRWRRGRAGW